MLVTSQFPPYCMEEEGQAKGVAVELFVRSDSTINFDGDYSKLIGYTIGMQRGTYQGDAFMQAIQTHHLKIDEGVDQEQNLRKLIARRFDIAVGPKLLVEDAARRTKESTSIKLLYSGVSQGSAYVAFSTNDKKDVLIEQLDLTLRKMRQDGSYRKIFGAIGSSTN